MKNRAFTLIELLVVVLIIGILASIAVPQYQKAVAKAELSQLFSVVKSLREAQEMFYLTNGQYADTNKILDIDIQNQDIKCIHHAFDVKAYVLCYNTNFALFSWLHDIKTECAAKTQDSNSAKAYACNSLTGKSGTLCSTCASCSVLDMENCIVSTGKQLF